MPRPVAGLSSTPPHLSSPRFGHSMKQSSAVVSSARLFGRTSSRVTSLPLKIALAARRTLELAWPLNVLIHLWSGARFTRKRTTTRLSDERFPSNVGSLIRMIGMKTPRLGLAGDDGATGSIASAGVRDGRDVRALRPAGSARERRSVRRRTRMKDLHRDDRCPTGW